MKYSNNGKDGISRRVSRQKDDPSYKAPKSRLSPSVINISRDASQRVKGSAGNVAWVAPVSGAVSYVAKKVAKKLATKAGIKGADKYM